MKHIFQAVDEQLSLNAVRSLGEKLTPQARVLVDMAKAGTCGQPATDRQQHARLVREVGQFGDDAAASEALIELSQHLDLAEDSRDSHELCARAVGEAWRRHAPFRVSRAGDPLDVITPHLTPAEAVLALDRARALPPAPAAALLRRMRDIGSPPNSILVPYSRSLSFALLGDAEAAYRDFVSVCPHGCGDQQHVLEASTKEVEAVLSKIRSWIESEPSVYNFYRPSWFDTSKKLIDAVDSCTNSLLSDVTVLLAALRLQEAGAKVWGYVAGHEGLLEESEIGWIRTGIACGMRRRAKNDTEKLEEKRRLFPDFYPEDES